MKAQYPLAIYQCCWEGEGEEETIRQIVEPECGIKIKR